MPAGAQSRLHRPAGNSLKHSRPDPQSAVSRQQDPISPSMSRQVGKPQAMQLTKSTAAADRDKNLAMTPIRSIQSAKLAHSNTSMLKG